MSDTHTQQYMMVNELADVVIGCSVIQQRMMIWKSTMDSCW